jgi:hypothetical protein
MLVKLAATGKGSFLDVGMLIVVVRTFAFETALECAESLAERVTQLGQAPMAEEKHYERDDDEVAEA